MIGNLTQTLRTRPFLDVMLPRSTDSGSGTSSPAVVKRRTGGSTYAPQSVVTWSGPFDFRNLFKRKRKKRALPLCSPAQSARHTCAELGIMLSVSPERCFAEIGWRAIVQHGT